MPVYAKCPIVAPAPGVERAYVVRGVDLLWIAKRSTDGEVITKAPEKVEATSAAMLLGYSFKN